ncbi:sugar transferase [Streptomyces sp. AK02-01A]|uniref:sugar transferase n=1 Tax=Streptomyces sp. AK02-01A TaxID=3028648 RepID=UPI0029AF353B|nr:sugar transferase [Streptomyces sp. AK02-01A]MDX3851293.1 sugar transferase [Streptomyces sp. AK02-01A]
MSTESTSVPPPYGHARTVGEPVRRVSIGHPRDTSDRAAPPPHRPASAPLRFGLPLLAGDVLAALLSTTVLNDEQADAFLIVQLVVWVSVLNALAGLYRPGAVLSGLDQLPALGARIAVAWCATAAVLAALFPEEALGFTALLGGAAVQIVVACCCRSLVHGRRRAAARDRPRSALVVGTGHAARRMTALLSQHPEYGLRPVGIAALVAPAQDDGTHTGRDGGAKDTRGLPVLTSVEEIQRAVIQNGVQEAVFTDSGDGVDRSALAALFHEYGCATWFTGDGPWADPAAPAEMARHLWGFGYRRLDPADVRLRGTFAKRLLDVLMAGPALLAVSPVLLSCALAVRLCDGRGVLFRQERVGQDGRPFTLLKFRTLRPADEHESATRWSVVNDRRMSPVGTFLRRTSMDELPQLWNVLRGDMSLVGPRPERPFFVANFSKTHPGYAARHRMPVGITGLAQIHGLRGDTSIEDRSRFDNHYIDHWSLWQDVCILLRTAVSLVRPAGS